MKNILILTLTIFISCLQSSAQELLDTEKYKAAELFVVKKGYDIQERLKEIESIVGKEVTVFMVSGKSNKIKQTYTGIAEMANYDKITDKSKASLIAVKVSNNGMMNAYFPLTNDSGYRIYLTEKMKE